MQGTRFDSSNFDPILPWLAGCQLVALNYQTVTEPMMVNVAKFRENGVCWEGRGKEKVWFFRCFAHSLQVAWATTFALST